jgi:hypothetical protein
VQLALGDPDRAAALSGEAYCGDGAVADLAPHGPLRELELVGDLGDRRVAALVKVHDHRCCLTDRTVS